MPAATFHNLPDHKRQRFLQAAYTEFALHGFSGASISRLVKNLGIAKGSVYQYFHDKADLYGYLVLQADHIRQQVLERACPPGDDFFDWYERWLLVEVRFYLGFPHYAQLFRQVLSDSDPSRQSLAERLVATGQERLRAALPPRTTLPDASEWLLLSAPLWLFGWLTARQNLAALIARQQAATTDTSELVSACQSWCRHLRQGMATLLPDG